MKLKVNFRVPPGAWTLPTKTFLIMKLTIVLLITGCLQLHATGYAQKISLNEKNASLEKVFKSIRKQTGFYIFYKDDVLKQAGKVTINVSNVSIEEALNQCLHNSTLTFSIVEKTIIVKPKT